MPIEYMSSTCIYPSPTQSIALAPLGGTGVVTYESSANQLDHEHKKAR